MGFSLSYIPIAFSCSVFTSQICAPAFQQPFYNAANLGPTHRKLISPDVDALANSMLASWNSSGLAVAVVQRDDTVPGGWHREFASYGIAKDDGTPATPDTLFAIASNSKLFLALSTGLLISNETLAKERGSKLEWMTKTRDILPEWGMMDEVASRETTIQDMLSHRTGLPRHDFSRNRLPNGRLEMISTLRSLRPSAEFRETYQYNNLMYESLAALPSALLNQPYESYVAEHLFNPLNMSSSTYSVKDAEASGRFAHGFQWSMRDLTKGIKGTRVATVPFFAMNGSEKAFAGCGGAISSARDLSIWASMLLNKGRHPDTNETIVPEDVIEHVAVGVTVQEARSAYPEISPKVYGCAQSRYSYRGHEIIEHGGANLGFKTQVSRYPNDDLAIIVLSNDDDGTLLSEAVKWRITDDIFGLPPIDWDTRYRKEIKEARDRAMQAPISRPSDAQPSDAPFASMGRSYSHPAYGTLSPCYVSKTHDPSSDCSKVLSSPDVKAILAASSSEHTIPTFIMSFKGTFSTHIRLTHFNRNIFNGTIIWTNIEARQAEGYGSEGGVLVGLDSMFEVEWVSPGKAGEGLAFKGGFWGMGNGGRAPEGEGKASAEVWFGLDSE